MAGNLAYLMKRRSSCHCAALLQQRALAALQVARAAAKALHSGSCALLFQHDDASLGLQAEEKPGNQRNLLSLKLIAKG